SPSRPRPAPKRHSAIAAALTSVSKATGNPSAAASGPATSAPSQPGFGVVVIRPQPGEPGRRSTGPKQPTPSPSSGPASRKNSTARAIVAAGAPVGKVATASTPPRPSPIAQFQRV